MIIPENTYGGSIIYTDLVGDGYVYDDRDNSSYSSSRNFSYPHTWPSTGTQVTGNGIPASGQPNANVSGVDYYYFGFVEVANECYIGNYYGANSTSNKSVTGFGFKPKFVITCGGGSYNTVIKSGKHPANAAQYLNNVVDATDLFVSFDNDGFTVTADDDVNFYSNIYKQVYVAFGGAAGGVLPIELLHFDAERVADKSVQINWSTASEENNDYFTIERSEDGVVFEAIGKVQGAENSINRINYQFTDENSPGNKISYYRLKQTDKDGMSKTFTIDAVPCMTGDKKELELLVAQNPIENNELVYDMNLPNDATVNVQIIDQLGNVADNQNYYYSRGANRYSLDASELKTGVYILNVTDLTGNAKKTVRFVVNK